MRDDTTYPDAAYPAPGARTFPDTAILTPADRDRDEARKAWTRVARAGAGVTWLQVAGRAAQHGLAALAGSSPDAGWPATPSAAG
jgi:hypothetical protein